MFSDPPKSPLALMMPLGSAEESLAPPPAVHPVLLVTVGAERHGVPLDGLLEVVPARPIARIPGARPPVAGLANVRGRMLTVVDLALSLGLAPAVSHPGHRLLVVQHRGRRVAVAVQEVVRILPPDEVAAALSDSGSSPFRPIDVDALLQPVFG